MARSYDLKSFKEADLISYMDKSGMSFEQDIPKGVKVKLCSSDSFGAMAEEVMDEFAYEKAPIMISHVGGFYVTASLAGMAVRDCISKPHILFFDRKHANVENALFNTFLMKACETKEEYIARLFNLSNGDIVRVLKPSAYESFIERVILESDKYDEIDREAIRYLGKEKREIVDRIYHENKTEIDIAIEDGLISDDYTRGILASEFNLTKLKNYAAKKSYNPITHGVLLANQAKGRLDKKEHELFLKLVSHITSYLSRPGNYKDLVYYLPEDIAKNGEQHILANDEIYDGYKSLFLNRGSFVKFISGIDISTQKGVKRLEEVLRKAGFISDSVKENQFAIDLAFIPHMNYVREAYPLLKKYVRDYIMLYRSNPRNNSYFVKNSTATLNIKTLESIGAGFIEEERKQRKELKNLTPIEQQKGYPLLAFMAGANYGNIYHSEVDTNNMIDMAIANKVDTVYIQGLIYSTYYHSDTARRMLTDPTYETISDRLQAAKKVIEKLNKHGIKVIYQMGDEENQLYHDIFSIYTKELGVRGNNFLNREDLKSAYDWVRPYILQDLIPYMIRSGEDIANLYTDDPSKTSVEAALNAIKRYREGSPLDNGAIKLKPEFLQDTPMFRIVNSDICQYDEKDPTIAVNLKKGEAETTTVMKNLKVYKSGTLTRVKQKGVPQLVVDTKQPAMSITQEGEQVIMQVPLMIDDRLFKYPELLSGIKERILQDPTYKRNHHKNKRPNHPGGWIITGDIREKMEIVPYYDRVREVMEYVQRTGEGFEPKVVAHLNDLHIGALPERPEYVVKFLDYLFSEYNPSGLIFNGDIQQGHNFKAFPNESRHLGTTAMTQQMISAVKLVRPFMRDGVGVIRDGFRSDKIDANTSQAIIDHLSKNNFIECSQGVFGNNERIKRDIDYRTVDFKLPRELKPYESDIREKLSHIVNLEFADILRGNHEENSDWDCKGYDEIELLRQEMENLKAFSGSDIDVTLTEFLQNGNGDFVNGACCFRTINGYNNLYSHSFKGSGKTPTAKAASWLGKMSVNLPRIDKLNAAHFHRFETSVANGTLITITGSGCGQSGFEQKLGYLSQPGFVIDLYNPDGTISMVVVGAKFLEQYQVKHPEISKIGLSNFIEQCVTEEATILGENAPKQTQAVYQRHLVARRPNKTIGKKVDI